MKNDNLYIVIPCYNEEAVLEETTKRLKNKVEKLIKQNIISSNSRIMYVNDGSKDNTWNIIESICKKEKYFTGISLSRNKGHQNALLAGLMTAKKYADVVISMDADLQDDIDAIDEMLDKYYKGNDIVYGVRSSRKKDTFFKKFTAESFYKFMKFMGVDIVYNHADYRLASKRVLDNLEDYQEVNLFLRGIFPIIGYKNDIVFYERNERFAGESKYPLKKMLSFALDGITSFSVKPIKLVFGSGIIISILNAIVLLILFILKILNYKISILYFVLFIILFAFGINCVFLGIIGEYVGKIYQEVKRRPRYIISEEIIK